MAIRFANNAKAYLAAPITSADTQIEVGANEAFQFSTDSADYILATLDDGTNLEIVRVTSTQGGTLLNVLRGQESTTARSFDATTLIENRLTAGSMDQFVSNGSDEASSLYIADPSDSGAASAQESLILLGGASGSAFRATSLGSGANAAGNNSTAVGYGASGTGDGGVAVGANSSATDASVAVGLGAQSFNDRGIAIGNGAVVNGSDGLSLGGNAPHANQMVEGNLKGEYAECKYAARFPMPLRAPLDASGQVRGTEGYMSQECLIWSGHMEVATGYDWASLPPTIAFGQVVSGGGYRFALFVDGGANTQPKTSTEPTWTSSYSTGFQNNSVSSFYRTHDDQARLRVGTAQRRFMPLQVGVVCQHTSSTNTQTFDFSLDNSWGDTLLTVTGCDATTLSNFRTYDIPATAGRMSEYVDINIDTRAVLDSIVVQFWVRGITIYTMVG